MIVRALVALFAVATVAGDAHADGAQRFEGKLFAFSYPSSAATAPGANPSADVAVTVTLAGGIVRQRHRRRGRRSPTATSSTTATTWHGARVKNRAAWGMKAGGGPPRDTVRIGGKREWLRWRDRIGSVLGAQEQTMTCGFGSAATSRASSSRRRAEDRERADELAARIA